MADVQVSEKDTLPDFPFRDSSHLMRETISYLKDQSTECAVFLLCVSVRVYECASQRRKDEESDSRVSMLLVASWDRRRHNVISESVSEGNIVCSES